MQEGTNGELIEDESSIPAPEFLTFTLGDQAYAVEISKVLEIRCADQVTPLANAPAFIKGVVSVRGSVVPVVDLRVRYGIFPASESILTLLVVLQLESRCVAIVVDQACDVIGLETQQIRPATNYSSALGGTAFISGLSSAAGRMLVVIDIERLMSSPGLGLDHDALV